MANTLRVVMLKSKNLGDVIDVADKIAIGSYAIVANDCVVRTTACSSGNTITKSADTEFDTEFFQTNIAGDVEYKAIVKFTGNIA